MVTGSKEKDKVMEDTIGLTENNILVNGNKIKWMEEVLLLLLMELRLKESLETIKKSTDILLIN